MYVLQFVKWSTFSLIITKEMIEIKSKYDVRLIKLSITLIFNTLKLPN